MSESPPLRMGRVTPCGHCPVECSRGDREIRFELLRVRVVLQPQLWVCNSDDAVRSSLRAKMAGLAKSAGCIRDTNASMSERMTRCMCFHFAVSR
jgi:hypothetical protein